MGEPLIIIGHHKEEFVFGEFLRETMGKTNPNLLFYEIKNSCSNDNKYRTDNDIKKSYDEIINLIDLLNPSITIDIHTTDSDICMWRVELMSYWEAKKLATLNRAHIDEFPVKFDDFYVPQPYPHSHLDLCMMQDKHPFLTLEYYLLNTSKAPYEQHTEFTRKVIDEVLELY